MLMPFARRLLAGIAFTSMLALLVACPAPPPMPPNPGGTSQGKACTSAADCAAGEDCQGPDTCGSAWTCAPARSCTMDLIEYCGCDGTEFRGSSTCPGRPYQHRGRC